MLPARSAMTTTPAMPRPAGEDALYTKAEAAALLDCSQRHLERLAANGDLRPTRIGRNVRYRLSELRRYLDAATQP